MRVYLKNYLKKIQLKFFIKIDIGRARDVRNRLKTWFSKKLGGVHPWLDVIVYAVSDGVVDTYTYVILYPEGDEGQIQEGAKGNCYYIIPDKHYD